MFELDLQSNGTTYENGGMMVNFNYPAKYGTAFEDFGSWVDVSHEEFLYDMTQQPEVFHINSHVPFIGFSKRKLTNTGRVAKNESVWIPIKECVAITSPSSSEVLLLVPNLNDKVLPRFTHWEPGQISAFQSVENRWSGYTKRFIDAFVGTGKMDWDRPIPLREDEGNRTRFKNKLHKLLMGLDLSWHNPDYYSMGYGRELDVGRRNKHYETQTEIEDEAREKFLSAVFQNANAMNENYEAALPTEPPYYLQYVVDKKHFLDNLQAAKNQYDYVETDLGGGWSFSESCRRFLNIKVLTEVRGLSPQGRNIKLLNWVASKNLLDYLDIAPNPLRPFLWDLELINDKHGNLVPYGTHSYTGRWGIRPSNYRGIHGLLPLNKWRSISPQKAWLNYSLGIESGWDTYGHILDAESFNLEAHDNPKGFCPICGGYIPNAEHRGKYPGAMSRYDNETEICSLCGSAEALAPMMDGNAGETMKVGYQNRDWDMWRQGVNIGRGAVKEMMDASAQAAKIFKEKGL